MKEGGTYVLLGEYNVTIQLYKINSLCVCVCGFIYEMPKCFDKVKGYVEMILLIAIIIYDLEGCT